MRHISSSYGALLDLLDDCALHVTLSNDFTSSGSSRDQDQLVVTPLSLPFLNRNCWRGTMAWQLS